MAKNNHIVQSLMWFDKIAYVHMWRQSITSTKMETMIIKRTKRQILKILRKNPKNSLEEVLVPHNQSLFSTLSKPL